MFDRLGKTRFTMKKLSVHIVHISICLFVALSFLTADAAAQTASELVASARVNIEKGNYDQAIKDLEQAAVSEPKNAEILAQSSRAYYLKKDLANALTYANKALKVDGKNLDALNIRGKVKTDQKDISGALDDFTKAIKIDPNFVKPYLNRAGIYENQKDYDKAIADYGSVIAADPKNELAYRLRASAYYYDKADMTLALADINEALRIAPKSVQSLTLRGQIYIRQKSIEDAMTDLTAAIRIDPDYGLAWFYRANAHYIRGRLDESLSDFARALEIRPDDYSANYNRGQIYKTQKKFDLAIIEFNKIPATEPSYQQARTELDAIGKIVGAQQLAARLHIVDRPFKPLFDPHAETIHERIRIKVDKAYTSDNPNYKYQGLYEFRAPEAKMMSLLLSISLNGGETAGHRLLDLDEPFFLLQKQTPDDFGESNIQYRFATPLTHKYQLEIVGPKPTEMNQVDLHGLDPKYLRFNNKWDYLNKMLFFFGHASAFDAFLEDVKDENGQPLSKNPDFKSYTRKDRFFIWKATKPANYRDSLQAFEAILTAAKENLDPTNQTNIKVRSKIIKVGVPMLWFQIQQVGDTDQYYVEMWVS
jgi:tetratricopeptide (TPR) repeat protein